MKKVLSLLLVIVCLLAFCSCNGATQDVSSANTQDVSSANKLVYGEKYIQAADILLPEEQQNYYIFEKDHLIYHYYRKQELYNETNVYHYTATCKYEIMEKGVLAYFYDSAESHDDNTEKISHSIQGILLFSENVLTRQAGGIFIRQSYLENELPNFGKE